MRGASVPFQVPSRLVLERHGPEGSRRLEMCSVSETGTHGPWLFAEQGGSGGIARVKRGVDVEVPLNSLVVLPLKIKAGSSWALMVITSATCSLCFAAAPITSTIGDGTCRTFIFQFCFSVAPFLSCPVPNLGRECPNQESCNLDLCSAVWFSS